MISVDSFNNMCSCVEQHKVQNIGKIPIIIKKGNFILIGRYVKVFESHYLLKYMDSHVIALIKYNEYILQNTNLQNQFKITRNRK